MGERLARVARVRARRSSFGPGMRALVRADPAGAVFLHAHAREEARAGAGAAVGRGVVLAQAPERGLGLLHDHRLAPPLLEGLLGVLVGIPAARRPGQVDLHHVEGALGEQLRAQLVVDHVVGRRDHRLQRPDRRRLVAKCLEWLDLGHGGAAPYKAWIDVVRAACPHDCPDTCAMLVDGGRRRARYRRERQPRPAGHRGLPLREGLELPRPGLLARAACCIRWCATGRASCAGRRGTRRSIAWRRASQAAIDEHGGESILPYSYAGTQGLIQGDLMSARVMNALGATRARAHDLRHRRHDRGGGDARASPPRSTPSCGRWRATWCCGAGTRCPPRRTCGG